MINQEILSFIWVLVLSERGEAGGAGVLVISRSIVRDVTRFEKVTRP